ncbi:small integral membrane protein 26 [Pelodiscus sinensis]|uniref:small integral membrane protein 26 n=1 Tax=Pelodiscus sinensis TaxID=13735 RepID=UPI003F6CA19D
MDAGQAQRWRARLAGVYALGAWGLVGSLLFYYWTGRWERPAPPGKESIPPNEPQLGFRVTSVITYKQDPTPGLYDKVRSFFATNDGPGPEE